MPIRPGAATTLSLALARIEQPRPLRARRWKVPALWPPPSRPPPLPAGQALVRRTCGDLAGSPRTSCPLARPCGGNSVPDDARRARSGAPGQRSHQQPAEKSASPLSALPHAARSPAPSGAALDHLPAASGIRRSLSRSISGIDRRTDIETTRRSIAKRINVKSCLFRVLRPLCYTKNLCFCKRRRCRWPPKLFSVDRRFGSVVRSLKKGSPGLAVSDRGQRFSSRGSRTRFGS